MIFSSCVSILIVCSLFNPVVGKPGYRRENNNCALPVSDEVNYNMLPDSWYHILNTNDPVERGVPCYAFKYFRETPDGIFAEIQGISSAEKGTMSISGVIPFRWYQNGTSITRYDTSFEFLGMDVEKRNGASGGPRYIWALSRNPHPTGEDILRLHNKLVTIGGGWNAVPLYLSGCRKLSMPETIAY
uniref:uncharacterized protein LOC120348341 isoform X2 n=1 Tax=Styela clava TaxID=7725 RepID=UPI001939B454|nr:uncharacterized protein LOC120348341 isoform X2 [Styela clava]